MASPQVASSLHTGRFTSGVLDAVVQPRVRRSNPLSPVVYLHGVASNASEAVGNLTPAVRPILAELARRRTVVAPTAVGNWGNATGMARLNAALSAAVSFGASSDPPVLVGVSHGAAWAVKAAAEMTVAKLVLLIPAIHMQQLRVDDPPGLNIRAWIDSAFGVTYPAALPAGAESYTKDISGTPTLIYHAPDDPVSVDVATFASNNGADLRSLGNLGHTNAAVAAVPISDVASFVEG